MSDPTAGAFKDHFSDRAAAYAQFRPRYPAALFDWLATLTPGRSLAWDAGTGNGQAALGLAERFDRVLATDASSAQLASATPHPRVAYQVARAESCGLASASCDLVTAAQALHWFDPPAFFGEVGRVLRPGGALAVWVYVAPRLVDAEVDAPFQSFCRLVHPFWPPERAMTEDGYRGLAFPFDEVAVPALDLELRPTLPEFTGYLRTWSATRRFIASQGHDPVDEVEAALRGLWHEGARRLLRWPVHIRAGVRR